MGSKKREMMARKKVKPVRCANPKYVKGETGTYETQMCMILGVDNRPDRSVNSYQIMTLAGVKHFIREDQIT